MNVKRYFAPTAREALRALKEELGADAIVLSNRTVDGGVEVLALPPDAIEVLQQKPVAQSPVSRVQESRLPDAMDDDFHVSLSGLMKHKGISRSVKASPTPAENGIRPFEPPRIDTTDYRSSVRESRVLSARNNPSGGGTGTSKQETVNPADIQKQIHAQAERIRAENDARVEALQEANTRLMDELSGIRGMIERQLAGFAWGETQRHAPGRAAVMGELLEVGFSGQMVRSLGEDIMEHVSPEEARVMVRNTLGRLLRMRSPDDDMIDQGGVFALVGPTGVGKTTTTAKIAARCVVRHGAGSLALITTDGYRIGAQEQLRIYGRILGVPVFSVRDGADLRQTLAELGNKHMVLIDTMGMSQRDRAVAEQAAMLASAGQIRRLLLLNATCRGDTLDDVVRAYSGNNLEGCIFTKVDEAASLAPVLDVAVRHQHDLLYIANGQRVPEDLHLPNRAYLLHRALREPSAESPWRLEQDEAGLMLSAGGC